MFRSVLILLSLVLIINSKVDAQTANSIDVFVDCEFCDLESIKQNITYVNYPIDMRNANVHALFTRQTNGSGGKNVVIQYYGRHEFQGVNDSISYSYDVNATTLDQNQLLNQYFEQGLLGYIIATPLRSFVQFNYEAPDTATAKQDRWRNWICTLSANGRYTQETSFRSITGSGSIVVRKITDEIKISSYTSYFKRTDTYTFDDQTVNSLSENFYSSNLIVKSINNHWSYGGELILRSSFYENIKFQHMYWAAIEYNLFPYSESNRRQLRITPEIGYDFRSYNDTTIFDKIKEGFFVFDLLIAFELQEKWGNVGVDVEAVSFLYDTSKFQLSTSAYTRLRLIRGLSLDLRGNIDMVRNQINVPREGLTSEDILLQQRQLATNFRLNLRYGFSYTFGSQYNNVVNPRFGW